MKTKSILFCLALAVYANTNIIHAQVNVQDSLALVDLYNSTDGPNWFLHCRNKWQCNILTHQSIRKNIGYYKS